MPALLEVWLSLFDGCTLYISARSPFARRVRLAFREHGIDFKEQTEDVFQLPPDFKKINPLLRVPVAVLKSGEGVIDSNAILQLFYSEQSQSLLIPRNTSEKILGARWSGMAIGLCEMAVLYFLESIRKEKKSDEHLQEFSDNFKTTVQTFAEFLGDKEFVTGALSQADLDMVCGLTYLRLRHPQWDWPKAYPNVARYVENLERRESFTKTLPPA